jgi:putative SOS response-associated peptidase YedK
MCGRVALGHPSRAIRILFGIEPDELEFSDTGLLPRYNIAPTQGLLACRATLSGERDVTAFHWGFVPSWSKDPKDSLKYNMINARGDKITASRAYAPAFKRRRCLIPVDGFYEWKGPKGQKQPYRIHMKSDAPFALGGIWEHWEGADGSVIESCAIITTEPNPLMASIHNRMPVIIAPDRHDAWLDPELQDPAALHSFLEPFPDAEMDAHPVSKYVNNARNEGPECSQPIELEGK